MVKVHNELKCCFRCMKRITTPPRSGRHAQVGHILNESGGLWCWVYDKRPYT